MRPDAQDALKLLFGFIKAQIFIQNPPAKRRKLGNTVKAHLPQRDLFHIGSAQGVVGRVHDANAKILHENRNANVVAVAPSHAVYALFDARGVGAGAHHRRRVVREKIG